MGRSFNYQGPSVAFGDLPDADPNTGGGPAGDRIFKSPTRTEDSKQASAVAFGLVMDTTGTVDVTPWVQDEKDDTWFAAQTEVGVANRQLFEVVSLPGADVFFQLTNPAGFGTVQTRGESTV